MRSSSSSSPRHYQVSAANNSPFCTPISRGGALLSSPVTDDDVIIFHTIASYLSLASGDDDDTTAIIPSRGGGSAADAAPANYYTRRRQRRRRHSRGDAANITRASTSSSYDANDDSSSYSSLMTIETNANDATTTTPGGYDYHGRGGGGRTPGSGSADGGYYGRADGVAAQQQQQQRRRRAAPGVDNYDGWGGGGGGGDDVIEMLSFSEEDEDWFVGGNDAAPPVVIGDGILVSNGGGGGGGGSRSSSNGSSHGDEVAVVGCSNEVGRGNNTTATTTTTTTTTTPPAGQATSECEGGTSSYSYSGAPPSTSPDEEDEEGRELVIAAVEEKAAGGDDDDGCYHRDYANNNITINDDSYYTTTGQQQRIQEQQQQQEQRANKRLLQGKLASAVFSHPRPLAQYCVDAYTKALELSTGRRLRRLEEEEQQQLIIQHQQRQQQQQQQQQLVGDDEDDVSSYYDLTFLTMYPTSSSLSSSSTRPIYMILLHGPGHIIRNVQLIILNCTPISVTIEIVESTCDLSVATIYATSIISTTIVGNVLHTILDTILYTCDVVSQFNPLCIVDAILSAKRHAVGKTGDVLISGIQSVATGVGSVSNAALNRLSRSGLAVLAGGEAIMMGGSSRSARGSRSGRDGMERSVTPTNMEKKLFHRLQKMESVSKLVAYSERKGVDAFSGHAKKRAQRIMHYNVSFRPFTATIQAKNIITSPFVRRSTSGNRIKRQVSDDDGGMEDDDNSDSKSVSSMNSSGSAFMRTPTSFPPTPQSRLHYFERGSQFTENVVFLARDQLRVERGVLNHNEQTRAMSKALIEGSRLAVFDASCIANGVTLTCGQHIATKTGNPLYSSTRSMIPVMRNSYVYFEVSVSPSMTMATLLVGLSTLEMPLDTLVGAYPGSVGLCSTGQMLSSGQWSSLGSYPEDSSFGSSSTVGCLVYLDDNSAVDTSEGPHITVDVTFNINGNIIPGSVVGTTDGCGEPTTSIIVAKAQELFPTVTLHSSGTSVMCRFSAEDMLASSRTEIGALSGVVVYAVDGSVILDESEDDEFLDGTPGSEFLHSEVAL